MGLSPLDTWRAEAERLDSDAFVDLVDGPVLVHRERLDGDLHFMSPGATAPLMRPGSTLIHVPRTTAKDRLTGPSRPGRTPVQVERILVLNGSRPLTVGRRTDNDLVLRDFSVSSRHAHLHPVPNTDWVFVVDQGSRNGTGHNGRGLIQGERAELITGDELCFGREVMVFLNPRDLYRYLTGTL